MNLNNRSSMSQLAAHHGQVVGDHTPADPAMKAILASVQAAIQTVLAFSNTDATFNADVPATTTPKPGLLFVAFSVAGLVAAVGARRPA